MAIKLIILGVRRSGTTIFWKMFQQDKRLVCYDEPFNPLLRKLGKTDWIKNPVEFEQLAERDGRYYWELYRPIERHEELLADVDERLEKYNQYLADQGDYVVMDTTRCHWRIDWLKRAAPDAVFVHLYRTAAANATSHLLPSGKGWRADVRKALNKKSFWTRTDQFNNWGIEELVGRHGDQFEPHLKRLGIDPDAFSKLPAVAKLMGFWRVHFEQAEQAGREHFGEMFISQNFDHFCRNPQGVINRIYERMDLEPPQLDVASVHPANPPYEADSPRWDEYHDLLKIPRVS